jgi:hypothetical protein
MQEVAAATVAARSPAAQIALGQSAPSFPAVGIFWNDSDASPEEANLGACTRLVSSVLVNDDNYVNVSLN